jgi:hypothetical protein
VLFGIHLVMIVMSLLFYVLSSSLCVSICEGNAAVSNVGDLDFVKAGFFVVSRNFC